MKTKEFIDCNEISIRLSQVLLNYKGNEVEKIKRKDFLKLRGAGQKSWTEYLTILNIDVLIKVRKDDNSIAIMQLPINTAKNYLNELRQLPTKDEVDFYLDRV